MPRGLAKKTRARCEQIMAILEESPGNTVRHIFYKMTDPNLDTYVDKTESGYNAIVHCCGILRDKGMIPMDWIIDSSRSAAYVDTFTDPAQWLNAYAGTYRTDPWVGADWRPQVWVESRSLQGIVSGVAKEYAVDLFPAGGFSSKSFIWQGAEAMKYDLYGRQPVILYIGDYDAAGFEIERALEESFNGYFGEPVPFQRIGITEQQIEERGLPRKPRKLTEKRRPEIRYAVEAEAMAAQDLQQLLRQALDDLLPADALDSAKAADAAGRNALREIEIPKGLSQ